MYSIFYIFALIIFVLSHIWLGYRIFCIFKEYKNND